MQQLKSAFKRTMKWNKYQPKLTLQERHPYLYFSIDPSFQRVNIIFVLSIENKGYRTVHTKYHLPAVEIEHQNVVIDGQNIFHQPVKDDLRAYYDFQKIEISEEDDYLTGCLLNYIYFTKYYK